MGNNFVSKTLWGTYGGKDVYLFKIDNLDGTYVELTNYGASVVSIVVPDKFGILGNVVLGFPVLQGYINDVCYLGATIGRYANRIANGRFCLDEVDYQLQTNDRPHSNHSGSSRFHSKVFDHEIIENGVLFSILSEHGDGGFPGNLRFVVTFSWVNMKLNIKYIAETNQNTIVNITNHSYFNLTAGKKKLWTRVDYPCK